MDVNISRLRINFLATEFVGHDHTWPVDQNQEPKIFETNEYYTFLNVLTLAVLTEYISVELNDHIDNDAKLLQKKLDGVPHFIGDTSIRMEILLIDLHFHGQEILSGNSSNAHLFEEFLTLFRQWDYHSNINFFVETVQEFMYSTDQESSYYEFKKIESWILVPLLGEDYHEDMFKNSKFQAYYGFLEFVEYVEDVRIFLERIESPLFKSVVCWLLRKKIKLLSGHTKISFIKRYFNTFKEIIRRSDDQFFIETIGSTIELPHLENWKEAMNILIDSSYKYLIWLMDDERLSVLQSLFDDEGSSAVKVTVSNQPADENNGSYIDKIRSLMRGYDNIL